MTRDTREKMIIGTKGRGEKRMVIYISGGITGVKDYEKRFNEAEAYLAGLGYDVINPIKVPLPKKASWEQYMAIDLQLLDYADAIYMLKGWENSRGAKAELAQAIQQGKEVFLENTTSQDVIEMIKAYRELFK